MDNVKFTNAFGKAIFNLFTKKLVKHIKKICKQHGLSKEDQTKLFDRFIEILECYAPQYKEAQKSAPENCALIEKTMSEEIHNLFNSYGIDIEEYPIILDSMKEA